MFLTLVTAFTSICFLLHFWASGTHLGWICAWLRQWGSGFGGQAFSPFHRQERNHCQFESHFEIYSTKSFSKNNFNLKNLDGGDPLCLCKCVPAICHEWLRGQSWAPVLHLYFGIACWHCFRLAEIFLFAPYLLRVLELQVYTVVSGLPCVLGIQCHVPMLEPQVPYPLSYRPSPTLIFKLCRWLALQAVGVLSQHTEGP